MYVIIDTYHLGYCLCCLNIISSDHPYSDASRLTSRDLYKRKREKEKKQKQEIEEHSVQSSPVNMEETSVIDSNIREETSEVRKRQVKSGRDMCDRQQYKRRE